MLIWAAATFSARPHLQCPAENVYRQNPRVQSCLQSFVFFNDSFFLKKNAQRGVLYNMEVIFPHSLLACIESL